MKLGRNTWIFASYIVSKENSIADYESRRLEPESNFSLSHDVFKEIFKALEILKKFFGSPEIDFLPVALTSNVVDIFLGRKIHIQLRSMPLQ